MAIAQKKPGLAEYDVLKPKTTVPTPQFSSPTSSATTLNVPQSNPVPAPPTQPKPVTTASAAPTLGIPQSNPVPTPPTNYGGKGNPYNEILYSKTQYEGANGNKALQQWSSNNATQYYNVLDPTEAALIKGMNAAQLTDYLNGKKKSDTTPTETIPAPLTTNVSDPGAFTPPPIPSGGYIPTPQQTIPSLNMDEIGKYVDSQLAAELARQTSAANQAKNAGQLTTDQQLAALRQAADRLKGQMTEQRGIENVDNARRLSPFTGRSDATLQEIERQRGMTDRQLAENQQMQEANIQANLAQLKNEIDAKLLAIQQTSGAERERMIQSLRDSERAYSMQEAQLEINRQLANSQIGNTNFNQSLSSWQANRGAYEFDKNFGLQEGQLTGNYQGQRTLGGQQLDSQNYWNQVGQGNWHKEFDYNQQRDARKDFESDRLFEYGIYRDNVNDSKWKQEFEKSTQQFSQQMGYNWASLNQREKQIMAEQTAREQQTAYNQMKDQFSMGMESFKATGAMPDYMKGFGINVDALKNDSTKAEIEGLYIDLAAEKLKPEEALKRIDQAEKVGLKDAATAKALRDSIYLLYPETSPESKKIQQQRNEEIAKYVKLGAGVAGNVFTTGLTTLMPPLQILKSFLGQEMLR